MVSVRGRGKVKVRETVTVKGSVRGKVMVKGMVKVKVLASEPTCNTRHRLQPLR